MKGGDRDAGKDGPLGAKPCREDSNSARDSKTREEISLQWLYLRGPQKVCSKQEEELKRRREAQ